MFLLLLSNPLLGISFIVLLSVELLRRVEYGKGKETPGVLLGPSTLPIVFGATILQESFSYLSTQHIRAQSIVCGEAKESLPALHVALYCRQGRMSLQDWRSVRRTQCLGFFFLAFL